MSTCLDLPDRVREYLREKFNKEYLGTLTYTIDTISVSPANLYNLSWGLNQETYPFVMQGEFMTEDQFFCYIVKQI